MVDHQRSPTACGCRAWISPAPTWVTERSFVAILGRAQPLPHENRRIVEVDELAALVEVDRRERERQAAPDEIGRLEGRAGQPLELLRDRGDRFHRDVQAAVELGVVVAPVALEHAREPERPAPCAWRCGLVPGKAAEQDHA